MSEGRDWFALVAGGAACPDCSFEVGSIDRADLGPTLLGEARRWEELLGELDADDDALRRRPTPERWSAIEYGGHISGVFAVFAERVRRCRLEDDPDFGWWDHEQAVVDERFAERPVGDVRAAIADGAVALALALPRLDDPDAWKRAGRRRGGERFSIEGLARFALHESAHHRYDARRSATGDRGYGTTP
jgi:hypothetical protein